MACNRLPRPVCPRRLQGANKSPIRQTRGKWVIEPEKSTQPSRQLLRTEEVPLGISLIGSWLACPKSRSVQRLTCLVQDGETRSTWGRSKSLIAAIDQNDCPGDVSICRCLGRAMDIVEEEIKSE